MAESKTFVALLKLAAKLDSSFSASMRKAVSELEKVNKTTDKIGKSDHFGKLAHNADKSFAHIEHRAESAADRIKESFKRIGEFAAGEMLAHGIERLFDAGKELAKGGFEVRA